MAAEHSELRAQLVAAAQSLQPSGLGIGASGNLSARVENGYLVTPTGVNYAQLRPADIVRMDMAGERRDGDLKPSSEWRFHQDIYLRRTAVNAIVHTHSPYATALACARQDLPAFHYMVAAAGGASIRCAEYATFGTRALSEHALRALGERRRACLLANHGVIALGADVVAALQTAQLVEELARQYLLSRAAGTPVLLDEAEMALNLEKIKDYGRQE